LADKKVGQHVSVTEVPNCTTMRAGLLIAQLPQLSMWTKRDSKMKAIFEFSVVFMHFYIHVIIWLYARLNYG
jgi:hypothetical protein